MTNPEEVMVTESFEAIGTHWTIQILLSDEMDSATVFRTIRTRIEEFDVQYSRFRSDSLITKMSKSAGTYTVPSDAEPLLDLYRELYAITDGAFTPLIGETLSDAGYDAKYSLNIGSLYHPPAWDDVLQYSYPTLTLFQPALLDFGAAGKGYLVDIVARCIEDAGITEYVINAGGDIRVRTKNNRVEQIGLEHPENPEQVIGVASLTVGSICGSAGNRRVWNRKQENEDGTTKIHHIINPHTLASPENIRAVWVTADTALIADGLTTCFYLVPSDILLPRLEAYSFHYLIVYADYSYEKSQNFPAEIFV